MRETVSQATEGGWRHAPEVEPWWDEDTIVFADGLGWEPTRLLPAVDWQGQQVGVRSAPEVALARGRRYPKVFTVVAVFVAGALAGAGATLVVLDAQQWLRPWVDRLLGGLG